MEKQSFTLSGVVQAHNTMATIWQGVVKPEVARGQRLVVTVKEETRSDPQNKKLHAMLGDIARQVDWAGGKRSITTWKRLVTAAWLRARGEPVEILPAIDGHGVDIVFERTSRLTKPLMAELIEFVYAWGAQAGVEWTE